VAPVDARLFAWHPEWTNAPGLLLDRMPSSFVGAVDAPVKIEVPRGVAP
jgi:hypothetical protein